MAGMLLLYTLYK